MKEIVTIEEINNSLGKGLIKSVSFIEKISNKFIKKSDNILEKFYNISIYREEDDLEE